MYELSRVRLHSVGPAGARYQDVVLDFGDVGAVINSPKQDALFSAGIHLAEQGRLRRPSPASVLFLENGGGKSVLIKLIFSVMLPGRRQVVGTTSTKVLEKFVAGKDVSHVVLEWLHTETGQRVITGKVSEWRGHVVSSDSENLVDSWYCFRPTPSLALDSLPLTTGGRLLTMSGFHDRLGEVHAGEPELELFWTRRHHEWTARLDGLGLDTELFRYQRAMNAGEGEAADAFAFTTDEAFAEFLLRAILAEDEPRDLAEVVSTYAHNLAQRGELIAERDFVAGALDLLSPLAEEESLAMASRNLADVARSDLGSLAAQVAARDKLEQARLDGLEVNLDEVKIVEKLAEGDRRRLSAVVTELRRLVAGMRLEEAQESKKLVDASLAEAKVSAEAWRAATTVLTHLNATREARDIRGLVGSREQKAQPALEARNAAAGALARGLLSLARKAQGQADKAESRVAALRGEAEQAQTERDEAANAAAANRAEAQGLSVRIAEVHEEIADAVRSGILPRGSDAADAAKLARTAVESATAELVRREQELERMTGEVGAAQAAMNEAHQAVGTTHDRYERGAEGLDRANRRTDGLAADPRLVEVLGTESVALETDIPALLERLRQIRATAEREQTALRVEESADDRALAALGAGGLLPPPEDVQAALDALENAGVTAWSGWRYLSKMDAEQRVRTLARVPQLVSGVLLNDAGQAQRAKEVLSRLLPSGIVAVGSTEAVYVDDLPDAFGIEFLVPPNPAMYDEESADKEREAITLRQTARLRRLEVLSASLATDAALSWKLTMWREDYPPGSIAMLAEQVQSARMAQEAARLVLEDTTAKISQLTERSALLRERLPELRKMCADAEEKCRRLETLSARAARIPQWTDDAERASEIENRAVANATEAAVKATRSREQAGEEQRTADGHRRTATTARAELAEVRGASAVSEDDLGPAEPVDALRRSFASTSDAYAKVEVGSDLRGELEQAENAESSARAALEGLDEAVRLRAGELLETPDGSDASARAAAYGRASRTVAVLEDERAEIIGVVATRKAELGQLPPAASLDSADRPRDIEHGLELIDAVGREASVAARKWEDSQERRRAAEEMLDSARSSAAGFGALVGSMAHLAHGGEADRVYDGDVESARTRYASLNATLTAAQDAVDAAEKRVRCAADLLAQYATEKRFEKLTTPIRQQVISVRRDSLPSHVDEWAAALRPRLRTLTDDLAQIDRHRSGIITRLQGMVDGALRTLRSAQRVSRLPDGLGEWSGQEFLRIRFTELEDNLLSERLGAVIDEAAIGKTSAGRDVKRDGMSLLLRGVQAAAPKGFRIDMLKPDSVLRTERQRVSEIRDVFSGGQQLTAAIILYCTLAALRANNRGRMRNRHSGVLFLDNPIGRASAGYLLELQRAVAEALGVQLIYTTGLFDAGALSGFPLIVRLRNDADLRAGRKYLSVDTTIRQTIDELGEPDGVARLSATRLFSRQVPESGSLSPFGR